MSQRAVAIVDGEHYAPVVRAALAEVPYAVVAAVMAGGTEKLRGGEDYGVPLVATLEEAVALHAPDVVLDLSDEPVLDPVTRFRLVARSLAAGVPYVGPGFRFDPPPFAPLDVPSIAVIGTGKRMGKTAVTGGLVRHAARERSVVVVAMGRGGPEEPELVESPPTIDALLALSRAGRHAASDHLETALFTGATTIGCRRCGGGLAGEVATSTVAEGVALALTLDPDLVVLDGSGAAMPPVEAGARLLVASAHQPEAILGGYLTPYRALLADLVLVTMADDPATRGRAVATLAGLVRPGTPVVPVVLRPRPAEPIVGERVAWFGTSAQAAPAARAELEGVHGAVVTHVSDALSDRSRLRAELAGIRADTFVVEIKAAAIDVVAEEAAARGIRLVPALNDVVAVGGASDLAGEFDRLLTLAGRVPAVAR